MFGVFDVVPGSSRLFWFVLVFCFRLMWEVVGCFCLFEVVLEAHVVQDSLSVLVNLRVL